MTEDGRDLLRVFIVLVIAVAAASLASFGNFLQVGNFQNLLQQNLIVALVAVGQFIVVLTRGIDLSVASVVGLSSVVAVLLREQGVVIMVLGAVASGALVGLLNGILVSVLRLPAFLITLGTMQVVLSAAKTLSGGGTLQPDAVTPVPALILGLYTNAPLVISNSMLLTVIAVFLVVAYFRTVPGRSLYAVGGNDRAARLAGLRVVRLRVTAYVICSMLAAVAGLLFVSRVGYGDPQAGGFVLLLDSIAAVTVGGASLYGGNGTVAATIVGVLIIGVFNNLFNIIGVPATLQPTIKGLVILAAVYAHSRPFSFRLLLGFKDGRSATSDRSSLQGS